MELRDSQSIVGNATGNDSGPEDIEELETDIEIPLAELKKRVEAHSP